MPIDKTSWYPEEDQITLQSQTPDLQQHVDVENSIGNTIKAKWFNNKIKLISLLFTIFSIFAIILIDSVLVIYILSIIAFISAIILLFQRGSKKIIPIILIVVNIIIFILITLAFFVDKLKNSNTIGSTLVNSDLYKITPVMSDFYRKDNKIKVSLYNNGDDISLTMKWWSKSNDCINPSIALLKRNDSKDSLVHSWEIFSVVWDCENEINIGDVYQGNLFFEYIRGWKKQTYQFYMKGSYE